MHVCFTLNHTEMDALSLTASCYPGEDSAFVSLSSPGVASYFYALGKTLTCLVYRPFF